RAGAVDGPVLGTVEVEGPVGEWTEVSAELTGATGTTDVYFTFAGGDGDLFELDAWSFEEAGAGAPSLDVDVDPDVRCVAGRGVLAVRVVNNEAAPVSVDLASPYGTRSVPELAPGARATLASTTRQTDLPASTV